MIVCSNYECYNKPMNEQIIKDIKENDIKTCYLIYGEERYLCRQNRQKLLSALVADGDTMNFTSYEGKGIHAPEIIDLAETLPFLAEKRVLYLSNSGFFKGSAPEELVEYIKEIPSSTCIVFEEEDVDKRSKLYKAISKYGVAAEFGKEREDVLSKWILTRLKKEGKKITGAAMETFLSRTGNDMERIDKELEKLLCYAIDRDEITEADIDAVCSGKLTENIFEMVNALASRDKTKAFSLYNELIEQKESPMHILFLVTRQFQNLLQVKDLREKGYDASTITTKTKLPAYGVKVNMQQCAKFSRQELSDGLRDGVEAESAIKSGKLEERTAVELFLAKHTKNPSV